MSDFTLTTIPILGNKPKTLSLRYDLGPHRDPNGIKLIEDRRFTLSIYQNGGGVDFLLGLGEAEDMAQFILNNTKKGD